ncbi:MAG: ferrous iron transporter B, partial [Pseudomonadota bacterium]|nr:ferrous iron transporter B [Pseudomonadota bacterium]
NTLYSQDTATQAVSAAPAQSNTPVFGVMYERFGGALAAFSYLLFILLYVPCVSATAAMVRELNRGWAVFSVFWTTGVAYGAAVLFYQLAQITEHFWVSTFWTLGISAFFGAVFYLMRQYALQTPAEAY